MISPDQLSKDIETRANEKLASLLESNPATEKSAGISDFIQKYKWPIAGAGALGLGAAGLYAINKSVENIPAKSDVGYDIMFFDDPTFPTAWEHKVTFNPDGSVRSDELIAKQASLLESNTATEKSAGDTSMPTNFSQEKLAGAFADAMKRTNLINTFKDTGSIIKDTVLKEPLGVIGPMVGGLASIPLSIALTGKFDKKTETPEEHRSKLLRNMLLGFGTGVSLGFGGATIKPFLNRLGKYNDLSRHKEQFINAILNKTDAFKNPMTTEQANRMNDWVADKGKQTINKVTDHLMKNKGPDAVLNYMNNLNNAALNLRIDKQFWEM